MLYQNIPAQFYTDASAPKTTSKYFVYTNGTIRAKTAVNELHVRPEKNIMFIKDIDGKLISSNVASVEKNQGDSLTIVLNDSTRIAASKVPDTTYNKPVDMKLKVDGTYLSGLHKGHTIAAAYIERTVEAITELECDTAAAVYVTNNQINVANRVDVQIIQLNITAEVC